MCIPSANFDWPLSLLLPNFSTLFHFIPRVEQEKEFKQRADEFFNFREHLFVCSFCTLYFEQLLLVAAESFMRYESNISNGIAIEVYGLGHRPERKAENAVENFLTELQKAIDTDDLDIVLLSPLLTVPSR